MVSLIRIFRSARRTAIACAIVALVGACSDPRRDIVRAHAETSVPDNLRLVHFDDAYRFEEAGGRSTAQLVVAYETILPTVREMEAYAVPEGAGLRKRISDLRGWALSSMPEEEPSRREILQSTSEALQGFRIKRVITPAGERVHAMISLQLEPEGTGWRIVHAENTAFVAGEPDRRPDLTMENSPEMRARFAELAVLADQMERLRADFLERKEQRAATTRAGITTTFATGSTFDGVATGEDGARIPLRLVVSRGLDLGGTVVVTLEAGAETVRAAQFAGEPRQKGSGEYFLQAVRSRALSGEGEFPSEFGGAPPVMRLFLAEGGLEGEVEDGEGKKIPLTLAEGARVEILPEPDPAAIK